MPGQKKAVVWVSTVLYVLIGLAVIGMLLAVLKPKIAEIKDKFITDQTMQSLNNMDNTILKLRETAGNRFVFPLSLNKGNFVIDGANEKIYWTMISNYQLSEENTPIQEGRINESTTKVGELWNITLELNYKYDNVDFIINGEEKGIKALSPASTIYKIWIENKGINQAGKQQIDFKVQ